MWQDNTVSLHQYHFEELLSRHPLVARFQIAINSISCITSPLTRIWDLCQNIKVKFIDEWKLFVELKRRDLCALKNNDSKVFAIPLWQSSWISQNTFKAASRDLITTWGWSLLNMYTPVLDDLHINELIILFTMSFYINSHWMFYLIPPQFT